MAIEIFSNETNKTAFTSGFILIGDGENYSTKWQESYSSRVIAYSPTLSKVAVLFPDTWGSTKAEELVHVSHFYQAEKIKRIAEKKLPHIKNIGAFKKAIIASGVPLDEVGKDFIRFKNAVTEKQIKAVFADIDIVVRNNGLIVNFENYI